MKTETTETTNTTMTTYTVYIDDGQGGEIEIEAASPNEAMEAAKIWATEDGDWDADGGTIWIDVSLKDEDGDELDRETLAIHPDVPDCVDAAGHKWESPIEIVGGCDQNPGCFGHGGGVIIREVCLKCGCGKTTDTWATRPDTGEQGLESVSYDADYSEEDADD